MSCATNDIIHLCQEKMNRVCQGLERLGLKSMAMYVIFNDGSHFVLSNDDIELNYQEDFKKLIHPFIGIPIPDHYLFAKKNENEKDIQPIFNIIRSHFEGFFVFRAFGEYPSESVNLFYEKTVKKFEEFCIRFIDEFIDLILSSTSDYRFSFVLNNKKLREAVIRQGYSKEINLSSREQECLWHTGMGKSAKEVAQALSISPSTVEQYLKRIKVLFECNKLQEIIIECIHRGIIGKTNYFKQYQA